MAKKKRTKPRELTQEAVDRGIYQDIVLRQGDEVVWTIPPELQLNQLHSVWDVIGDALTHARHPVVRQLCDAMNVSTRNANLEALAIFAYQLGRLVERLEVMPHEPAALTGKKCRSGGAAGAQAKRLTPDEKQAKTDLYQAGLEALRKKHPNLKQEALIHKLSRQLGQGHSVRTIKTYLPKSK